MNISSAMSFVGECIITVFFFWHIHNRSNFKLRHVLALILAVAIRFVLYMSGVPLLSPEPINNIGLQEQLVRLMLRLLTTVLYLYSCKECSTITKVYWAGFETVIHNAFTCMRACTFIVVGAGSLAEEPLMVSVGVLVTEIAAYYIIYRLIDVQELDKLGPIPVIELVLNTVLNLVIKWGITSPEHYVDTNVLMLALLADIGLTISMVAVERNQQMRERQLRLVIEKMELKSEVNNALRAQRADENLRRLYHDMKNHLLAIQSMAGDKKELNDYLGELLPQLEEYGSQLYTGSAMIDALLGDKRERAAAVGVRFHVQLDLTPLSFMNNAELVSIFGNAVDNAVEAARECTDDDERCVYIKSRRVEDMFFLSFENHYAGERSRQAGCFRTRKADKELHGIGLGSIEKAVHKYSGEAQVSNDNATRTFRLNIMLPIQKP